jgi:hypothetical protein
MGETLNSSVISLENLLWDCWVYLYLYRIIVTAVVDLTTSVV